MDFRTCKGLFAPGLKWMEPSRHVEGWGSRGRRWRYGALSSAVTLLGKNEMQILSPWRDLGYIKCLLDTDRYPFSVGGTS